MRFVHSLEMPRRFEFLTAVRHPARALSSNWTPKSEIWIWYFSSTSTGRFGGGGISVMTMARCFQSMPMRKNAATLQL